MSECSHNPLMSRALVCASCVLALSTSLGCDAADSAASGSSVTGTLGSSMPGASDSGTASPGATTVGSASATLPPSAPTLEGSFDRLDGFYWFERTAMQTVSAGNGGYTQLQTLSYSFLMFDPSGYVYVGTPRADVPAMKCTGPRQTASGGPECLAYSVDSSAGTLTIGTSTPDKLTKDKEGWRVGADLYRPVPSLAGRAIDGSYRSASCSGASCSEGKVVLDRAGHYSLSGSSQTIASVGDTSLIGGSSGTTHGTYTLGANSLALQPSCGATAEVFAFLDEDTYAKPTLVLGSEWYERTGDASPITIDSSSGATCTASAPTTCDPLHGRMQLTFTRRNSGKSCEMAISEGYISGWNDGSFNFDSPPDSPCGQKTNVSSPRNCGYLYSFSCLKFSGTEYDKALSGALDMNGGFQGTATVSYVGEYVCDETYDVTGHR